MWDSVSDSSTTTCSADHTWNGEGFLDQFIINCMFMNTGVFSFKEHNSSRSCGSECPGRRGQCSETG